MHLIIDIVYEMLGGAGLFGANETNQVSSGGWKACVTPGE